VNCICGCGQQVGGDRFGLNLLASEVALELIAWDRARALRSPVAAEEIEAAILGGAPRYQELIAVVHDEVEPSGESESSARGWLRFSRDERHRVHSEQPAVPKKRIRLSAEEEARVDRRHPERSFSGTPRPVGATTAAPADFASAPTALELELGSVLHAARDGGGDFERLAVGWLGRLIASDQPSLDQLRWLLGRLEDARSGRIEEAEPALRRFLADGERG
jgi:hypothetical protein